MFNFKQLFAYETIKVFGVADRICDPTDRDRHRKMGVSEATFYNWKKKYGGLGVSELRRLKNVEEENSQLKKLFADLSLDNRYYRTY